MNIWTNGCYDILHIGHMHLLKYAKSLGNKLYVGIDSDQRIAELKGNNRPINNCLSRKFMLENIRYVDHVIVFNTDKDLENAIIKYNIDIIVVGDDYKYRNVIGSDLAQVKFFPKIKEYSTTNLVSKIKDTL